MPTENILHSAVSPDWWTPIPYVEAARHAMGGQIDLDPQTTHEVNQTRVKAAWCYTAEDDCFTKRWEGRVFLNPSGDLVRQSWQYLLAAVLCGDVPQAVWVGYSLQQLQTLQRGGPGPWAMANAICLCSHRIKFDCSPEEQARLQAALDAKNRAAGTPLTPWKNAPTHGNYFAYFGPSVSRFREAFSLYGEIR